jgi:hypothetical protein
MIVLYGFETSSLTMTEKLRLRVSENMALRDTYWPKREALTADWMILQNE